MAILVKFVKIIQMLTGYFQQFTHEPFHNPFQDVYLTLAGLDIATSSKTPCANRQNSLRSDS